MADLESALHYILRVEVGRFSVLEGQRLMALKKFVTVLTKVSKAMTALVPTVPHVIECRPVNHTLCPPSLQDLAVYLGLSCPFPWWLLSSSQLYPTAALYY